MMLRNLTGGFAQICWFAAKIPQVEWQAIVDALVASMRKDRFAEGFAGAVVACGAVLKLHFPADGENPDELPDRLYVI